MTEKEVRGLLQLLVSKDPKSILLGIQILYGFEEIPLLLQFLLGQLCRSEKREIAVEAKTILKKRLIAEEFEMLKNSLLVFVYSHQKKYAHFYHIYPSQMLPQREALKRYSKWHSVYSTFISEQAYFLKAYLKAGIFWTYESKVVSFKTRLFFEAILQFYPEEPNALLGLGYHFRCNQKEAQKSIAYYQKFLEYHPNLAATDEMHTLYKSAAFSEIDLPTTFNAYQHLAYLYHHQLEDSAKAIYFYQKARKQSPQNSNFGYYFLAKLLWEYKDDCREALKIAEEGLSVLNQNEIPMDRTFNGLTLGALNHKKDLESLIEAIQVLLYPTKNMLRVSH